MKLRIVKLNETSRKLAYLLCRQTRLPGKNSKTGREVFERMMQGLERQEISELKNFGINILISGEI